MNTRRDYTRLGRTLVAAATLSVLALFVAVPRSHADGRAKCQQKIERYEAKLGQAIRQHGERSPQANDWRRALNNERDWDREQDRDRR